MITSQIEANMATVLFWLAVVLLAFYGLAWIFKTRDDIPNHDSERDV